MAAVQPAVVRTDVADGILPVLGPSQQLAHWVRRAYTSVEAVPADGAAVCVDVAAHAHGGGRGGQRQEAAPVRLVNAESAAATNCC